MFWTTMKYFLKLKAKEIGGFFKDIWNETIDILKGLPRELWGNNEIRILLISLVMLVAFLLIIGCIIGSVVFLTGHPMYACILLLVLAGLLVIMLLIILAKAMWEFAMIVKQWLQSNWRKATELATIEISDRNKKSS